MALPVGRSERELNKFVEDGSGNVTVRATIEGTTGDLTVNGDLTVTGSVDVGVDETVQGQFIVDTDNAEAFLVRKDGDVGDIFTVDTSTPKVIFGTATATGTASDPIIAIGNGDSGFYESADNIINITLSGTDRFIFSGNTFYGNLGGGLVRNVLPTDTIPSVGPNVNDLDTGLGWAGADTLSIIAGAKEIARAVENTTEQFIINPQADLTGTGAAPSLAFGDANTGFYESSDNELSVSVDGSQRFIFTTSGFQSSNANGFYLENAAASSTNPTLVPDRADLDTGIGSNAADQLSLIAGGAELLRLTEDTTNSLLIPENDIWLGQTDSAGTGVVNEFKVNASDEIEVGAALTNLGSFEFEEDSGAVTLANMPVSSSAADGTEESMSIRIDSSTIATFKALSDGAGSVDTKQLLLPNTTALVGTPDAITATSEGVAASLASTTTEITTNGDTDLDNVTLADGVVGQIKVFAVTAVGNAGDSVKITPATFVGGTQITFSASPLGLGCTMMYTTNGWVVVGNNGGVIA